MPTIPPPSGIAQVLGGPAMLGRRVDTLADLEALVVQGLPKKSLRHLAGFAADDGPARTRFIHALVPEATFKRRREHLTVEESERVERVARIVAAAHALWDDGDEARAFLNAPHPLLEGRTPLAAARTGAGARRVEEIIAALEWGLPV
jgi:putative toxin-antitoxin system antitoxin component (TIGR02293 family)